MSDIGLYKKFRVERTDATRRHDKCEYFVLDMAHDRHALAALRAYADSVEADEPRLAHDLRERWLS